MVHSFYSSDATHSDHHILSLEAFFFPVQETDPVTTNGVP